MLYICFSKIINVGHHMIYMVTEVILYPVSGTAIILTTACACPQNFQNKVVAALLLRSMMYQKIIKQR